MSSTIHFLVPEEQPRGPAPFPASSRWAGASIGFSGAIIETHTTYLKENIKLCPKDIGAEMERIS